MKKIMKLFVFTMAFLSFQNVMADIRVIESKFDGEAIEVPGGIVHVISPKLPIGGESRSLYGSADTAKVVCDSLGMKFVGYAPGGMVNGKSYLLGFTAEGTMYNPFTKDILLSVSCEENVR